MIFAFLLSACDDRPQGVASESEMVNIIADMEVAETYLRSHSTSYYNDSIRDSAVRYVLNRHGMTKADFDSTMNWYGRNIDKYQALFAKVDQELNSRAKKATGKSTDNVKTNDLWPYSRHLFISENSNTNSLVFSIPASDLKKGDRLNWKLRLNTGITGNVMFGVEYDNGTSGYVFQAAGSSKRVEMTLQTDTSLIVRRIFGSFRTSQISDMPLWLDSITLEAVPFDSTQYYRRNMQRFYVGPKPLPKTVSEEKEDSVSIVSVSADSKGAVSVASSDVQGLSKAATKKNSKLKLTQGREMHLKNKSKLRPE